MQLTIIYPPTIDYNFLYQRPQQLMKAFGQLGCESVFVNSAVAFPQEELVATPFSDIPNFKVVRADCFRQWNNIERSKENKTVLWISYGGTLGWIDFVKPDLVVYDSIDKATDEFSHWAQYVHTLERKSNIIFASAKAMYDDHSKRSQNVHILPNGADFEHFKIAKDRIGQRPTEFPQSETIIGYYGAMATWVDHEIVKAIAEKYKVVMIGAIGGYNIAVDHPNVTNLPAVNYKDLPRYLSWFDATIIPFKLTNMIEGCDPVKFYEYISAGKPVLTTEMVEMQKYSDVVYFINKDNAVQMTDKALSENNSEKIAQRMKVAEQNSWISRAKFAFSKINALVEQ